MTRDELLDAALAEEDQNKLRVLRELFEMECSLIRSYYEEIISAGRSLEMLQKTDEDGLRKQTGEIKAIIVDRVNKIKTR